MENTQANLDLLFSSIGNSDYKELRSIAHKMLPMFKQLEVYTAVDVLERLEHLNDETKGEQVYETLSQLKQILTKLELEIGKYLIKLPVGTD